MEFYLSDKEFTQLALKENCLSQKQLVKCKDAQKNDCLCRGKMLHEIAISLNFITVGELEEIYKENQRKSKALRIGNYQIKSILGEGGLGIVYLAKQMTMKRLVALKVLYRKWVQDEEFRKRFLLEARIVGQLSHPNLIQVFDVGFDKGHYFFSMEYVPGKTLEEMINDRGSIPMSKAIEIIFQILDALNYIWRKKLVHRDIKPSNVIVTKEGTAKLGDFGFVKSKMDEKLITNEEFVLGTPDYMSPEQAMGREKLDYRSDIYSLGGTLYHMLTGSAPYSGTESVVIRQHIKAAIPSPKSINPELPEDICYVIEKMMAKEPQDRYQNYENLKRDLKLVKQGERPQLKRLDIHKSTIAREGDYFGLSVRRIYKLEQEVRRLRYREIYYQIIIGILCFILISFLIVVQMTKG